MNRRRLEGAARAALWALGAATSAYCLLCFLPFAWTNFISGAHYPRWVAGLVAHHGLLALATAALGAAALRGRGRAVWGTTALAAAAAAAAAGWLAARGNNGASLVWAFAAWAPYLSWEALADRTASRAAGGDAPPRVESVLLAACFAAAVYSADALARGVLPPGLSPSLPAVLAWSLLAHAAVFLLAALALDAARIRPRARGVLLWLAAAKAMTWAFISISFTGPVAWAYALLTAATLFRLPDLVRDAAVAAAATRTRRVAASAAMAAYPWAVRTALSGQDWNRLFESTAAVALWGFAAEFFSALPPLVAVRRPRRALWTAGIASAALLWSVSGAVRRWSAPLQLRGVDPVAATRAYESADISLTTARRIVRRVASDAGFYALLQENTNLPRGGGGGKDLEFVKNWDAGLAMKPNVFILVIDSLRPDYLGAYDPKVRFTPSFDAFARDAVVFRQAFTSYGGTGLSEPSIWTGARIPHRQYPQPFPPLNTLEKLVDRDGYRPLITMDAILSQILKSDKRENALDKKSYLDYKLCRTIGEIDGRLDQELAAGKPLFIYTQPQDVHISAIQREGAKPVSESPDFNGFYAPYASRVARMDACFGRFISGLKKRGIYENSIIVLAADHGDSLGEDGRWGHAYTLFPEILRVPLIVKVPKRLLAGRFWDPDAAAFLTDVSPSLYALLGHEPDVDGEPFGRPLFESDRETFLRRTRPERPVVSSYGPVYGLLRGAGRELYLADGVNYASYLFDLSKDPAGTKNIVDPEKDAVGRAALRAELGELRRFYNY